MYYLWHTRLGGWFTKAGTVTTQLSDAGKYDQAEALKLCRIHKGGVTEYGLIPILIETIEAL